MRQVRRIAPWPGTVSPARAPKAGNASSLLRLGAVTTLVFEHEFPSQQAARIVRNAHERAAYIRRQLRRSVLGRDRAEVVALIVRRLALLVCQRLVHLLFQRSLRLLGLLPFGGRLGLRIALRGLRLAGILALVAALAFTGLVLRTLLALLAALPIGTGLLAAFAVLAVVALLSLLALLILALVAGLALLLVLLALAVFLVVLLVLVLLLFLFLQEVGNGLAIRRGIRVGRIGFQGAIVGSERVLVALLFRQRIAEVVLGIAVRAMGECRL